MTRSWLRPLLVALIVACGAGSAPGQGRPEGPLSFVPPPFAWWRDPQFRKDLGLSTDQSSRIEAIWQQTVPHLRHKRDELEAQEAELSRLVETDSDEGSIRKQSDRVESIRSTLNTARTLMLVQMRQALTPEQRTMMTALLERNRGRRPPPRRN